MRSIIRFKAALITIFLLAFICLVVQPALADGKSKNKGKSESAVKAGQKGENGQNDIVQILANGPPMVKDDPGYYYKMVPGTGEYLVKYFKNGHPINASGWTLCSGESWCQPPYGQ